MHKHTPTACLQSTCADCFWNRRSYSLLASSLVLDFPLEVSGLTVCLETLPRLLLTQQAHELQPREFIVTVLLRSAEAYSRKYTTVRFSPADSSFPCSRP